MRDNPKTLNCSGVYIYNSDAWMKMLQSLSQRKNQNKKKNRFEKLECLLGLSTTVLNDSTIK